MKKIIYILTLLLLPATFVSAATLDYSQPLENYQVDLGNENWVGKTFTAGNSDIIYSVKVKIYVYANCINIITAHIRAVDTNDLPTGGDLATGTINCADVTTDTGGNWYEILMSSLQQNINTNYALILSTDNIDFPAISWLTYRIFYNNSLFIDNSFTNGTYWEKSLWNTPTLETYTTPAPTQPLSHYLAGAITLPAASSSDLFASVGILTSDLWILLVIAMGVPLAFYIFKRIISLTPKK